MPGLKRNLFSSLVAAQKGVETVIEKNGSSFDLGRFSVQLTRLDDMQKKVEEQSLLFAQFQGKHLVCSLY